MLKKLLLIMCSVFLLAGAAAFEEGEIYTQAQINNADFTTIPLECSHDGTTINTGDWMAEFSISCLGIEPRYYADDTPRGDYVVLRNSFIVRFPIAVYIQCRQSYSVQQCNTAAVDVVVQRARGAIRQLRTYYASFQTRDISGFNPGTIGGGAFG